MKNKNKFQLITEFITRFVLPVTIIFTGLGIAVTNPNSYISSNQTSGFYSQFTSILQAKQLSKTTLSSVFANSNSKDIATKENVAVHYEIQVLNFIKWLKGEISTSEFLDFEQLKLLVIGMNQLWVIIFYFGLLVLLIDTFVFGKSKNRIINRLIQNIGILIINTTIAATLMIGYMLYTGAFGLFNSLLKIRPQFGEVNKLITSEFINLYSGLIFPIFIMIFILFLIWLSLIILRYFRVFSNNPLQNVLINSFIHKRAYTAKPKSIRQKIQDFQKIKEYNQKYNSNSNNFTKYNTSLPTNQDFAFDYLGIKEFENKSKLATIITETTTLKSYTKPQTKLITTK
jgi:hypothetical protein